MQARRAMRLAVWAWTRSRLVFASFRNSTGNRAALAALHAVDDFNRRNNVFVHVRCLLPGPIHTAHVTRVNVRQRPLTRVDVCCRSNQTQAHLYSTVAFTFRTLPRVAKRHATQIKTGLIWASFWRSYNGPWHTLTRGNARLRALLQ